MLEQYAFGVGSIYMIPQGVAVPQPVQVGTCQDISLDFSWASKPLQGRKDAPAVIARGALKITGKLKAAKFRVADIASTVFGATPANNTLLVAEKESAPNGTAIPAPLTLATSAQTASGSDVLTFAATTGVVVGQSVTVAGVPAGTVVQSVTSTTVTMSANATAIIASATNVTFGPSIAVTNAATYQDDVGVINASTGIQMSRVASAPATGEYSVANGVYVFATADAGQFVLPSYTYTKTAGSSFIYYAQEMGPRPSFIMQLENGYRSNNPNYSGVPLSMRLYNVGIDKFAVDAKNEDWIIPESDFSASQDWLGRVYMLGGDNA